MGLEYARQLAARGYDLILVSNRQDELDSAVSTLSSQFPVSIRGRYQDLSLPSSADDLTAWCQSQQILPAIATPLYRMSPPPDELGPENRPGPHPQMAGKTRPQSNVPRPPSSKPLPDEPLAARPHLPTPGLPGCGYLEEAQKMIQL